MQYNKVNQSYPSTASTAKVGSWMDAAGCGHLEFEESDSLLDNTLLAPDLMRVPISPEQLYKSSSGCRGVIFPFLKAWKLGCWTHCCHVVGSSVSAVAANWSILSKSQSV